MISCRMRCSAKSATSPTSEGRWSPTSGWRMPTRGQAVYFRARIAGWSPTADVHPRRVGFVACMIDQGFMFNGPNWEFMGSPLQGLAPRATVYEGVRSLDDFQPWLDQVIHFPEAVVDQARRQVPPQWLDGDGGALDDLLERLLERRRRVPELIDECRRARTGLFPDWI